MKIHLILVSAEEEIKPLKLLFQELEKRHITLQEEIEHTNESIKMLSSGNELLLVENKRKNIILREIWSLGLQNAVKTEQ